MGRRIRSNTGFVLHPIDAHGGNRSAWIGSGASRLFALSAGAMNTGS